MSVAYTLIWGFAATMALTVLLAASQGLGLTRMNVPYLLGTMFTPNRDRAKIVGFLVHVIDGWAFAFIYVAAFYAFRMATWWFGGMIGAVHGLAVLSVGLPVLPGIHPRMSSGYGVTYMRQLEPPGFLGLNYGLRTPISVLVAHIVYGVVLGGFYPLR
jgi:hypothetical protein